jgi:hypothetical protein
MIVLSSTIILVGLLLRAIKFNFIVQDFSRKTSFQNLGSMSIGYLVDSVLPFKIGTLIRIYLFYKLSSYKLTLIIAINILDRSIDIFFISLVSLYVLFLSNQDFERPEEVSIISVGVFIVIALTLALYVVLSKNRYVVRAIWQLTTLPGPRIQSILISEFIYLIVYIRKFLQNKIMLISYVLLSFLSWIVIIYGFSIALGNKNQLVELSRALIRTSYLIDYNFDSIKIAQYGFISMIGMIYIFIYILFKKNKFISRGHRVENFKVSSRVMSEESFVDLVYNKSKTLGQLSLDVKSRINILELYPGGSDAITIKIEDRSIEKERNVFIRKVTDDKYSIRLNKQIEWLKKTQVDNVPKVLDIYQSDEYLFYDMEYINEIKAFEFIHSNDIRKFQAMLFNLMTYFNETLYTNKKIINGKELITEYLEDKILNNLEIISKRSTLFKEIITSKNYIIINGVKMINLRSSVLKIFNSESFNKHTSKVTLSEYCHGDLTIDNMFVDTTNNIKVIDPSDDNIFSSPLIDLGRLMQSFEGGHEFSNLDNCKIEIQTSENAISINYIDYTTIEYIKLGYYLKSELAKNLIEPTEIPLLNLLVSSYFIRMIIHNLDISKEKSILFYSKAVIFANNYLNGNDIKC